MWEELRRLAPIQMVPPPPKVSTPVEAQAQVAFFAKLCPGLSNPYNLLATMASPHVAIAKASLAAALFRADVTVINRDSIAELHRLLENLISACSAANVQV
jgi:hypothetical protein